MSKSLENISKKYVFPDIGNCKVIYKTQRYMIFSLSDTEKFEHFEKEMCDYIFYDANYGPTATIKEIKDGELELLPLTNFESSKKYSSMDELVLDARKHIDFSFRSIVGR